MTTQKQLAANRRNAQLSTGPKSETGKAAIRLNATRHGLLSSAPVASGENEAEYSALCEQLKSELAPVGILETQIVARMTNSLWRLRRLSHIESGLLSGGLAQAYAAANDDVARQHVRSEGGMAELLANMDNGTVTVLDKDAYDAANAAADEARALLLSDSALLGAAYQNDAAGADALTKLARYETTLERSLFRAGAELERRQTARREREAAKRDPGDDPGEAE
jgi:hypothetical protein